MKKNIRDFTLQDLQREFSSHEEPAHRAEQVFRWVQNKGVVSFDKMTNLPAGTKEFLGKYYRISRPECAEHLVSKDGTEKFLWSFEDGKMVESVLIKGAKRRTLCLSTQVGCKYGCSFCSSGAIGFKRDLSAGEIVGQVLDVSEASGEKLTNLVFMGMGEPFDNYDNVERAIKIINDPKGIGLGARKITISTCGLIPGIQKLKKLGLQVELSVSLHAAEDKLRDELVPVNRKYRLKRLMDACIDYTETTGRIITFEYTLIRGRNDSLEDADKLASLMKGVKGKVNLIGCSASGEHRDEASSPERIKEFSNRLRAKKVKVTIRKSKGGDILAACGQLAAKVAKKAKGG